MSGYLKHTRTARGNGSRTVNCSVCGRELVGSISIRGEPPHGPAPPAPQQARRIALHRKPLLRPPTNKETNTMTTHPTPADYTVTMVASRNYNIVGPNGPVLDQGGVPIRFKSKAEALAEIDAIVADQDAGIPEVLDDVAIRSLDRAARLAAAMAESHLLSAWRAAGQVDPRPTTPILDFMNDPTTKPAPKAKGEPRTPATTDDDLAAAVRAAFAGDPKATTKAVADAVRANGVKVGGGRMTAAIAAVRGELKQAS